MQKELKVMLQFKQAMNYYMEQRFENALQLFQKIIQTDPHDRTIHFFIENVNKYLKHGVPENWSGVEEMMSK